MAMRPSQIRASSMDGDQMITSATALRNEYSKLTLPLAIIAGEGDRVVVSSPLGHSFVLAGTDGSFLEGSSGRGSTG